MPHGHKSTDTHKHLDLSMVQIHILSAWKGSSSWLDLREELPGIGFLASCEKDIQRIAGVHVHNLLFREVNCSIWELYFCLFFRVLVTFAQYLQKCPYEEHIKLVNEVTDFAKACVADESAANCDKSLVSAFWFWGPLFLFFIILSVSKENKYCLPHLRPWEHCGRGGRKIVRTGRLGILLWDCLLVISEVIPMWIPKYEMNKMPAMNFLKCPSAYKSSSIHKELKKIEEHWKQESWTSYGKAH